MGLFFTLSKTLQLSLINSAPNNVTLNSDTKQHRQHPTDVVTAQPHQMKQVDNTLDHSCNLLCYLSVQPNIRHIYLYSSWDWAQCGSDSLFAHVQGQSPILPTPLFPVTLIIRNKIIDTIAFNTLIFDKTVDKCGNIIYDKNYAHNEKQICNHENHYSQYSHC